MRLNIPHKRSMERRSRKLVREFSAQFRPATSDDLANIVDKGVGRVESWGLVVSDPMRFMDKRQRRRFFRRFSRRENEF